MKTYVVIGLGRFGSALAVQLHSLGNEVLVIDENAEEVQRVADLVTHAVVGDAQNEDVLRSLSVGDYDCAIVSIASDLAASVVITMTLKEIGMPTVICKAQNEMHKKALEKVGADRVIIPEREMAVKLAQSLTSTGILDFIELSEDYGVAEITAPAPWCGKTILELNVRAKYGIDIIALKRTHDIVISPRASQHIEANDIIVVLGSNDELSRLQKL